MDPISSFVMNHIVGNLAHGILPLMLVTFAFGCALRALIYYTAHAELGFAREFEKRVFRYYEDGGYKEKSFYVLVRYFLTKTYYDVFEMRRKFRRRHMDHVTSISDRLFLIENGMFRVVQDSLVRSRYIRRVENSDPKVMEITKHVFESNPYFNRIFGVLPIGPVNELLNILPGLFIIGGIFGTFLGIAKGIPELGGMNLSDADQSKHIMDAFLVTISQAMVKSIIGIGLSVVMSLINTVLSPDATIYNMMNKFTATLDRLWHETENNWSPLNEEPLLESPKEAPVLVSSTTSEAVMPPPPPLRNVGRSDAA